ncbi:MAG: TrkA C-terminal domain-containing protein [Clostridia bacterium]|nr:TrkA C-terminal domain-containing protein [Clostridia bacterium]
MDLLYIVILLIVLWLIIEIISIVLKITGLDLYKARFQVISMITHTGFTTRESELIVQHPLRRKIASVLMVISYIAQASLISLFFNAINNDQRRLVAIIAVLGCVGLFVIMITRNKYLSKKFNRIVEKFIAGTIMKKTKSRSIDEVLKVSPGYAVYEILVSDNSQICNQTLASAKLKEQFIQVLKVDRGSETIDFPSANFIIKQGDVLIVYGKINSIKDLATNG